MSQSSKNTKNSSLTLFKHHFLGFVLEINNNQVARIQELNLNYMSKKDMVEIVSSCFRKPKEGEKVKPLGIKEILKVIRSEYPTLKDDHGTITYLGRALSTQGFERTEHSHVAHYKVIPLKAA